MRKSSFRWRGALVCAGALFIPSTARAQLASSVISYTPGTGAAAGFNFANSALGAPSTFTVHEFGGPVDPYDPPFLAEQIVSIGAGGSLTLQMGAPIHNDPTHAFGLDFIIYGNAGFIISDFGAGTTDGTLFGAAAPGSTEVSVSADNVTYYKLQSSLAPVVDRFYPTDGSGLFGQPVNPSLTGADFAGKDLTGIRTLYGGSAGGAGFDLAWARDTGGNPVSLDSINYVRIDVLSGAAEVDGVVGVPEPATWTLLAVGAAVGIIRRRKSC